jgi:hypothetical protein
MPADTPGPATQQTATDIAEGFNQGAWTQRVFCVSQTVDGTLVKSLCNIASCPPAGSGYQSVMSHNGPSGSGSVHSGGSGVSAACHSRADDRKPFASVNATRPGRIYRQQEASIATAVGFKSLLASVESVVPITYYSLPGTQGRSVMAPAQNSSWRGCRRRALYRAA